jgi:GNAT superfamily N-acetyltransferase
MTQHTNNGEMPVAPENMMYKLLSPAELYQHRNEIIEVGTVAFGAHAGVLAPEHAAVLLANLRNQNSWNDLMTVSHCFVAVYGAEIAGMAHFIPSGNPWDIFPAEWCYLRMVSVKPQFQGRGIARKLTEMCLDHARQTGERTVALHTSEFMPGARHIYESLGFTVLHEIPCRFGKRYWLYTLPLHQPV